MASRIREVAKMTKGFETSIWGMAQQGVIRDAIAKNLPHEAAERVVNRVRTAYAQLVEEDDPSKLFLSFLFVLANAYAEQEALKLQLGA